MRPARNLMIGTALLAVLATLVAFGGSAGRPAVHLRAAPAAQPLLGIRGVWLSRFDPARLRPVGKRMLLETEVFAWAFSPDRRRLVLGANDRGRMTIVATRELRRVGMVEPTVHPSQLFWIGDRILGLAPLNDSVAVAVVDPSRRRIAAMRWIEGQLMQATHTSTEAVVLLGTQDVGPAALAVVDTRARVRRVELDRIRAGWQRFDGEEGAQLSRYARPALAVSPDGSRALVVGSGAPAAEVDLKTLNVTYHELSQPVSLLGRVRDWFEPRAHAKGPVEGPSRSANWLDEHTVAVYGADDHGYFDAAGKPQHRQEPAGVKLIDVRSWSVRTLDSEATWLVPAGGLLLTGGSALDSMRSRNPGIGLRAYSPDGERRYQAFGDAALWGIQVVGSRGVVPLAGGYAVIDVRSGRVMRRVRGNGPLLLTSSGGGF